MPLTWDDLIIDAIRPEQFRQWIAPWAGVVTGWITPAFLSKFGTWFLRRPEGRVEMLDVFAGAIEKIADSYEAFVAEVNKPG